MDTAFPTFRRLLGTRLPFTIRWPWTTTAVQRRSLLRMIMVATEEKLPLAEVIEAWAYDEKGVQQIRLFYLADLLNSGTALPDAVEQVRGVLGDDETLTLRFGAQSGTLVASVRDTLNQHEQLEAAQFSRWRKPLIYAFVVSVIAFMVIAFWHMKIVPSMVQIFEEFNMETPSLFQLSIQLAAMFTSYWFVFLFLFLGACWLFFASLPGRGLRRRVLGTLIKPLREQRFADVLRKLSVASEAGRPLSGALSTLARYHYDPALRNKLLYVRNEIEHGTDVWQSLGERGLLSEPEVRVLRTSERVGNRPWALRQLATLRKRRSNRRFTRWSQFALPIVIVVLGAIVLLQGAGMISSLTKLVESLAV